MIDAADAKRIADAYVHQMSRPDLLLVLVDCKTREEDFGWVFFYNSKAFLDTHDNSERVAGNAPFIVERNAGTVVQLGAARGVDRYIDAYRRCGDPFAAE
jgi:hypothetical protein